jgi:hypothetical protein
MVYTFSTGLFRPFKTLSFITVPNFDLAQEQQCRDITEDVGHKRNKKMALGFQGLLLAAR